MLRVLVLLTFAMIGAAVATPYSSKGAEPPVSWEDVSDEISRFEDLDRLCRGTMEPNISDPACLARDSFDFDAFAERTGWCLGRIEEAPAQYTWHLCEPGSLGITQPAPQSSP